MAKGRWVAVEIGSFEGPLQLNYSVEYEGIFGDSAMLMANNVPCAFAEQDAAIIVAILNHQIEQAVEYCTELIAEENKL